jgi:hypothetical protein
MKVATRSILISLCVLLCLISIAASPRGAGAAPSGQADCPGGACQLYLPLVVRTIAPDLIAPAPGEQTISLAPTFSWTPLITGTYQIQVSVDPTFNPAVAEPAIDDTVKVKTFDPVVFIPTGNLDDLTTFYWRVGAPQGTGYVYSVVRSFTTPIKNSQLLPPAVQLLAPANNSTLPSNSVTLSWAGAPGAIQYRLRTYDQNNVFYSPASEDLPGSTTSFSVSDLTSGVTYNWKVKALNQYGWGSYSQIFYFTVP